MLKTKKQFAVCHPICSNFRICHSIHNTFGFYHRGCEFLLSVPLSSSSHEFVLQLFDNRLSSELSESSASHDCSSRCTSAAIVTCPARFQKSFSKLSNLVMLGLANTKISDLSSASLS